MHHLYETQIKVNILSYKKPTEKDEALSLNEISTHEETGG